MENERNIVGYCMYCKDKIEEHEACVMWEECFYHRDCFEQMNKFYDGFDLDDNNE